MTDPGATWAFLGLFTGFWKLVLVASVALLFYGRSGLQRHPIVRALLPELQATRTRASAPARPWLGTRAYILLVVTAATAVAAWIVTRALIGPAGLSHP
jgi:hypothetical protein